MAEDIQKTAGQEDGLGDLSIEEALGRLDEIAAALESSETALKESLELYSEGVQLVNRCKNYLCDVQKEMITLSGQEGV